MRRVLPLLPALLLFAGAPAAAQDIVRPQQRQAPTVGPAPALPGLAARRPPAPIEASPEAAGLSPNAALFDAINRGDIAAARDAVGRGANLEARNQLGLTPLDAAVDQGRNEIAFYLLSARDTSRAPPPDPGVADLAQPPRSPAPRGPARREAASRAAEAALANAAAAPAAPRGARLWAGDGGAPRPEIGFLGFDAGRPAGAVPPFEPEPRRGRGRS
jgi:hypothetical protein